LKESTKLIDYDYYLPKNYIAQYALDQRDACRLLVLKRDSGQIVHRTFADILEYLEPQDTLVLNDTKVRPARLYGRRPTGGRVEVLLLAQKKENIFACLLRPGRLRIGETISFNGGSIQATILSKNSIQFKEIDVQEIYNLGSIPLPPYIKRPVEPKDKINYQTVYAKKEGSVASPTAGLHFTHALLDRVSKKGVNIVYLTLHIGYGTFQPIKCADISEHKMQEEYLEVSAKTLETLKNTKLGGRRVIAVGTSVVRALESISLEKTKSALKKKTEIFIYPGYVFRNVDCLLTNFHLPRTTPYMLVCAFAGKKLIERAYQEALENAYRFLSFGDSMLIL